MPMSKSDSEKRVLLVSNSAWNLYHFRRPIIEALKEEDMEVMAAAPADAYARRLEEQSGVLFYALSRLRRRSFNVWNNLLLLVELWRLYRLERPDLVIHFTIKPNIFGAWAARLTGVKAVCVVTGLGYTFLHRGWVQTLTAMMYRWAFRRVEMVVFENRSDRQLFLDRDIVHHGNSLAVNGCGIDTEFYSPSGLPQPPLRSFVFIGRLLTDKGIVEFVEAARRVKARYPDAKFEVVGELDIDNPASITAEQFGRWRSEGLIDWVGQVDDVRPYIARSSWVVLPSYREGLSRTLLEAMSMERPIITTDVPGCAETVDTGKNGFLVPPAHVEALAQAMLSACRVKAKVWEQMGRHGRRKAVVQFERDLIAAQYLQLVRRLFP